jgi:hypothetical protein
MTLVNASFSLYAVRRIAEMPEMPRKNRSIRKELFE